MSTYYQFGGYDNTTNFGQFADLLAGQQQQVNNDYEQADDVPQQFEDNQPDYSDVIDKFNDLNDRFESLYQKYGDLIGQQNDDNVNSFISQYEQENEPVDWMQVNDDIDNYTEDLGNFHQQLQNTIDQGDRASAAVRHNNPGNIKYSEFTKQFGAVPGDVSPEGDRFAHFPNTEAGLAAQKALLLSKGYRDLSIEKALNRWTTGDANKTGAYSKAIASQFGNKKISQLTPDELSSLINQQIKGEDVNEARNLGIKQNGGMVVADTPEKQYIGLNNPYVGVMAFPNQGHNTFRGLDNGRPVLLKDETGKVKVLNGNKDKTKMFGNVIEHRL